MFNDCCLGLNLLAHIHILLASFLVYLFILRTNGSHHDLGMPTQETRTERRGTEWPSMQYARLAPDAGRFAIDKSDFPPSTFALFTYTSPFLEASHSLPS